MAYIEDSDLKIIYDGGLVNGKVKLVGRTYTNVNPECTSENLNMTAQKIIELQNKDVIKVLRVDKTQIN